MGRKIAAIRVGFADGWTQPHELGTSWSVGEDVQELTDRAINVGQFARAGFCSEAWRERFWPFAHVPKKVR